MAIKWDIFRCLSQERAPKTISIQHNDPLINFQTSTTNSQPPESPRGVEKDPRIRKVLVRIENGCPDNITYASFDWKSIINIWWDYTHKTGFYCDKFLTILQNYQFHKFMFQNIFKKSHLQVNGSSSGGHFGSVRTVKEFHKRFHIPGFSDILTDYNKACFVCSTLERVTQKQLHPQLQPFWSEHFSPGWHFVNGLGWRIHIFISQLCIIRIWQFLTTSIRSSLTSSHTGTVAKFPVLIFFQYNYNPTKILSDLCTSPVADLIHWLSKPLELQPEHALLEHFQTTGALESSHEVLKRISELNTDEEKTTWFRFF